MEHVAARPLETEITLRREVCISEGVEGIKQVLGGIEYRPDAYYSARGGINPVINVYPDNDLYSIYQIDPHVVVQKMLKVEDYTGYYKKKSGHFAIIGKEVSDREKQIIKFILNENEPKMTKQKTVC